MINNVQAMVKWPGGKRWFVQHHAHRIPSFTGRYIEPFLGGASVYFFIKPTAAILSDINSDLINVYNAIKCEWTAVRRVLLRHHKLHSEPYYYRVRNSKMRTPVTRAARFLYLNRTCFNGIYRVNSSGEFNVPIGNRASVYRDSDDFEAVADMLSRADIRLSDFEPIISEAVAGDLVFADPPYTVRHNVNGFLKYNEELFSWSDQVRLANSLSLARGRGVKIISTNANHASVRQLYRERDFCISSVSRFSSISADGDSRKQFEELVIRSR